jgi:hypothetical protein
MMQLQQGIALLDGFTASHEVRDTYTGIDGILGFGSPATQYQYGPSDPVGIHLLEDTAGGSGDGENLLCGREDGLRSIAYSGVPSLRFNHASEIRQTFP